MLQQKLSHTPSVACDYQQLAQEEQAEQQPTNKVRVGIPVQRNQLPKSASENMFLDSNGNDRKNAHDGVAASSPTVRERENERGGDYDLPHHIFPWLHVRFEAVTHILNVAYGVSNTFPKISGAN